MWNLVSYPQSFKLVPVLSTRAQLHSQLAHRTPKRQAINTLPRCVPGLFCTPSTTLNVMDSPINLALSVDSNIRRCVNLTPLPDVLWLKQPRYLLPVLIQRPLRTSFLSDTKDGAHQFHLIYLCPTSSGFQVLLSWGWRTSWAR